MADTNIIDGLQRSCAVRASVGYWFHVERRNIGFGSPCFLFHFHHCFTLCSHLSAPVHVLLYTTLAFAPWSCGGCRWKEWFSSALGGGGGRWKSQGKFDIMLCISFSSNCLQQWDSIGFPSFFSFVAVANANACARLRISLLAVAM
jgi:hypothetical protein